MKKAKSTKRALLSAVLALVLCMSMFVGTTFAWFTDSVTSANNVIKSGNLDIELEYWNGNAWKDVKGESEILTNDLWEPGVTEVAYLRIKNAGSLAFDYYLGVNVLTETEGVNAAGKTFKLSDYIYMGAVEGVNGETTAYADRETAVAAVANPAKISADYAKGGQLAAGSDYVYIAMVVYMPESVGNDANHDGEHVPSIELGINAVATQSTVEKDSFSSISTRILSVTSKPDSLRIF